MSNDRMHDYARENVAHHTAALQAEIEGLRAEVERLKSMTAVTMGIGRGDGNLFVHGDWDSIKAAQSLVFSAEGMKKALKDIRSLSSINSAMNPNSLALTVLLADIYHIADTALAAGGLVARRAMTDRKRIAWELERTAMGDGYYGDALRVAKGFPEATPSVRALLDRWATGKQNGLSDRTDLCTFALQIYMSDLAREDEA